MMKLLLKSKDVVVLTVWLIPFVSTILLNNENPSRSIVLAIFLLVWLFGYFRSINKTAFSILFLIVVSSFNVTLTLGDIDACYKHSVFVNYLCPTLHIVDIFLVLSLLLSLFELDQKQVISKIFTLLPLAIYVAIHIITHPNLNSAITMGRVFLVMALLLLSHKVISEGLLKRSKIFPIFFGVLLVQAIIALLQFFLGRDLNLQFIGESNLMLGTINSSFISLSGGEFLRGYGTFPHPNILAGFALGLTLLSLRIFEENDLRLWSIVILSGIIVLTTLSRMHILLFTLTLLVYFVWNLKHRMFSFFPLLSERFLSLTTTSTAFVERIKLMYESVRIIKENMLLGVGSGEFVRYLSNDVRTVSNISLFQPVHNIFLLTIAEHGVFGFVVLFGYIFKIFSTYKKEILFTLLSILMILTIGMFDHYLLSLPQGLIILMMFLI